MNVELNKLYEHLGSLMAYQEENKRTHYFISKGYIDTKLCWILENKKITKEDYEEFKSLFETHCWLSEEMMKVNK